MTRERLCDAVDLLGRLCDGLSGYYVYAGVGGRTPEFDNLITVLRSSVPVLWLPLFAGLAWHVALPYARPFMPGSEARLERIRISSAYAEISHRRLDSCLEAERRPAACAAEASAAHTHGLFAVSTLTSAAHDGWVPGWRQIRSVKRASRAASVLCGLASTRGAFTRCLAYGEVDEADFVQETKFSFDWMRTRPLSLTCVHSEEPLPDCDGGHP